MTSTTKGYHSIAMFKRLGFIVTGYRANSTEGAFSAAVAFLSARGYNLGGEYCDVCVNGVRHGRKFRVKHGKTYDTIVDMSKAEIIHFEELFK